MSKSGQRSSGVLVELFEQRCLLSVSVQNLNVATGNFPRPVNVNGILYFDGRGAGGSEQLWKSDGTPQGTVPVNLWPGLNGVDPDDLLTVGGSLFLYANDGKGEGLWKTDGTAAGTTLLGRFSLFDANCDVNGTLFFSAETNSSDPAGDELWKSDGTAAGTVLVKDIEPGKYGSSIGSMFSFQNKLFFWADGGPYPGDPYGVELFVSDGTSAGTHLVKDINPGSGNSEPEDWTVAGGKLYFVANTDADGDELWTTDGTAAGTYEVHDFLPPSQDAVLHIGAAVGTSVYTVNRNTSTPQSLYRTDSLTNIATQVKQLAAKSNGDAAAYYFTPLGNKLVFYADDGVHGVEPWVTDGTAGGTRMIDDIDPGNASGADEIQPLVSLDGYVFFRADDGVHGPELWATDGTAANTFAASNLAPGGTAGTVSTVSVSGDTLFFHTVESGQASGSLYAVEVSLPLPALASISGVVFNDSNADAIQQAAEAGLGSVLVFDDTNKNGVLDTGESSTSTDNNGYYVLNNLSRGAHQISEVLSSGWQKTSPTAGTQSVSITDGQLDSEINFGVRLAPATGSISGAIFSDTNGNGVQDGSDVGLSGVTLFMDSNKNGVADSGEPTAVTDSAGKYSFTALAAGTYRVSELIPGGYTASSPATGYIDVSLTDGKSVTGESFADKPQVALTPVHIIGTSIGTAGSYKNQGNVASKAFDGSLSTFFDAPTASGSWTGLDLGSSQVVNEVRYAPRPSFASRMIGGMFQASNSASFTSGVVTLFTVTAAPASGTLTVKELTNATAYRYVRYLGPTNGSSNVSEIQFWNQPTLAQLSGTVIGTAGSWNNVGNVKTKVFDGSFSTFFDATNRSDAWVGLDLGVAKAVKEIKFAPRSGYGSRMVGGMFQESSTIDFSSDVVTVYAVSTTPSSNAWTAVNLNNTAADRYWRYLGPDGSHCDIAEIDLLG